MDAEDELELEQLLKLPDRTYPLAQEFARALEGAVYPLSRAQLEVIAQENEAPRTLLSLLAGLPNRLYASEAEVTEVADERVPT